MQAGVEDIGLHPVGFLRECINNQFLILRPPFPHPLIRVDEKIDIVGNIILLSCLIVQRDGIGCQGLQGGSDIALEAARKAYPYT
jgi:hypothetical protein